MKTITLPYNDNLDELPEQIAKFPDLNLFLSVFDERMGIFVLVARGTTDPHMSPEEARSIFESLIQADRELRVALLQSIFDQHLDQSKN